MTTGSEKEQTIPKSTRGAAGGLAAAYPDVWDAYAAPGKATSEAGPPTDRERRLVKPALAIGPLGLPRAVAAKAWIEDVLG